MKERFSWLPDVGASIDEEPNVRSTPFGDNYELREPIGINTIKQKWTLTFTLSEIEATQARNFLKARNGSESFIWKTPESEDRLFICKKWRVSRDIPNYVLTAEFEEVFDND